MSSAILSSPRIKLDLWQEGNFSYDSCKMTSMVGLGFGMRGKLFWHGKMTWISYSPLDFSHGFISIA